MTLGELIDELKKYPEDCVAKGRLLYLDTDKNGDILFRIDGDSTAGELASELSQIPEDLNAECYLHGSREVNKGGRYLITDGVIQGIMMHKPRTPHRCRTELT